MTHILLYNSHHGPVKWISSSKNATSNSPQNVVEDHCRSSNDIIVLRNSPTPNSYASIPPLLMEHLLDWLTSQNKIMDIVILVEYNALSLSLMMYVEMLLPVVRPVDIHVAGSHGGGCSAMNFPQLEVRNQTSQSSYL